jgi:alkylation response protein AidB-like acyl-CoA dehydrogenase
MITLSELRDSAHKAFPADALAPDREESWKRVTELGWLMIGLPEDKGGLGLGHEAEAAIHFEMGRVLSRAPLISAMLGLQAVAASTVLPDAAGWIERLCTGGYAPLHLLPANVEGDAVLTGRIPGIFDADMASHVVAALPGRYVLIPLDDPAVRMVEQPIWDATRRLFDIELDAFTPRLILAKGDAATALHDQLAASAQLGVAADALGGAAAALAMTVDYLGMRKQFDRPLAMFQALKHRCADLRVLTSASEALFWSLARRPDAGNTAFGAMKTHATEAYQTVTEEAIQLHGGIGLTEEHACHLLFKRAMLNHQLCGSADFWHEARGRDMLMSSLRA